MSALADWFAQELVATRTLVVQILWQCAVANVTLKTTYFAQSSLIPHLGDQFVSSFRVHFRQR